MGSRHQFHLRWSNYGHNLANSFVRLFESESLADVTLFCEGESYRAHRVVLAASSQHFQELFEQCSSARDLVVILDGTSPVNLRALLEFMYKGEVYIDDANLNTFLQTAKRLQVKGLSLSQNDLQNISNDGGSDPNNERGNNGGPPTGGPPVPQQDNILAQALGPLLQSPGNHQGGGQAGGQAPKTNQSPPGSFSSPSPSQTPPNPPNTAGYYGEDKHKKKFRITTSPKHPSPEGNIPDGVEYGGSGHHSHPPRPSAPIPSPSINSRMMEIDQRPTMGAFPGFGPMYPPPGTHMGPAPSPQSHTQAPQHGGPSVQQQTVVITENPNMRKVRSASTENTMPEDLSIKLEVGGREDELGVGGGGMPGKQRSFSMDLSPSDPPFGTIPGPSVSWSLPSPSSGPHVTSHDINISLETAQTTADGKKLKCPFCERLYGYETNLRAHIRQRHQGIRVPCPFCTRTFTRNNTVRRHVAREHRALLGGVGVRPFGPHSLHPDQGGGPPPFGSPPNISNSSPINQCSPNTVSVSMMGNNGTTVVTGGPILSSASSAGHHMNSSHIGGPSAAAIAAAVAAASASSNLPIPTPTSAASPPLSSASTGSGNSGGTRGGSERERADSLSRGDRDRSPPSRSSSIGSKPAD